MKKFFFLTVAAIATMGLQAQSSYQLANSIGEDGRYIVKWDCSKNAFAESNDFEPGETVTIAFDITGTPWVEELKNPKTAGATRCMAANIWSNYGPKEDDTNRLKQIKDNVYGATYNFAQCIDVKNPGSKSKMIAKDSVLYLQCQLFMFEYNEGGNLDWYVDAQGLNAPGMAELFATLPSTGKNDNDFYTDDFQEGMYGYVQKGYAAPCSTFATDIKDHLMNANAPKFIKNGHLYFDANGMRYNAMGATIAK